MEQIFNIFVFTLFTLLWFGFVAALIFNRELLDSTWKWFRRQNILVQLVLAVLLLPLVLGLWIWETKWPAWLRLVLVLALAGWNVYMFFPWAPVA